LGFDAFDECPQKPGFSWDLLALATQVWEEQGREQQLQHCGEKENASVLALQRIRPYTFSTSRLMNNCCISNIFSNAQKDICCNGLEVDQLQDIDCCDNPLALNIEISQKEEVDIPFQRTFSASSTFSTVSVSSQTPLILYSESSSLPQQLGLQMKKRLRTRLLTTTSTHSRTHSFRTMCQERLASTVNKSTINKGLIQVASATKLCRPSTIRRRRI